MTRMLSDCVDCFVRPACDGIRTCEIVTEKIENAFINLMRKNNDSILKFRNHIYKHLKENHCCILCGNQEVFYYHTTELDHADIVFACESCETAYLINSDDRIALTKILLSNEQSLITNRDVCIYDVVTYIELFKEVIKKSHDSFSYDVPKGDEKWIAESFTHLRQEDHWSKIESDLIHAMFEGMVMREPGIPPIITAQQKPSYANVLSGKSSTTSTVGYQPDEEFESFIDSFIKPFKETWHDRLRQRVQRLFNRFKLFLTLHKN